MIMKPSKALAAYSAELRQLSSHYGLLHPRILGSVLTGNDDKESDLDLLVDPAETTSPLDACRVQARGSKPCSACRYPSSLPPCFSVEFSRRGHAEGAASMRHPERVEITLAIGRARSYVEQNPLYFLLRKGRLPKRPLPHDNVL
jgi:hypothetical protein